MGAGKVLIADDEREFCMFMKNCLNKLDFDVDIAYDGVEARNLLANKYDFIFFDCNMPGLSGVELASIMRKNNSGSKKIMISGYGIIDQDFLDEFGIDVFLNKPVFIKDIERVVKNGE